MVCASALPYMRDMLYIVSLLTSQLQTVHRPRPLCLRSCPLAGTAPVQFLLKYRVLQGKPVSAIVRLFCHMTVSEVAGVNTSRIICICQAGRLPCLHTLLMLPA